MIRRRKPFLRRKRSCYFCDQKLKDVDYRDPHLRDFLTEKGKIVSTKFSGVCARHQRRLARAIKTARSLALLPYIPA
jgi:small subunit ribosomal protein S18